MPSPSLVRTLAGGTNGVLSYGSEVQVGDTNFGETVLTGQAFRAKHMDQIIEQSAIPSNSGNVAGYVYYSGQGAIIWADNASDVTGHTVKVDTGPGGMAINKQNKQFMHGLGVEGPLETQSNPVNGVTNIPCEGDRGTQE